MRRDVQLFVNNQRVDLFDWEDINIVDQIQDVKDIKKLFIPFSRKFTVPASKNNNKIFKHYYNQNLDNGFDARFKISAEIKINSDVYKRGRISLLGSRLKNDAVYSYDLVFYDGTIDLKTLIGEDMLSDIRSNYLDKFSIEYTPLNVFRGFAYGWNLVGDAMEYDDILPDDIDDVNDPKDLIFPFISSKNYYFYDSNNNGRSPTEGDTLSLNVSTSASAWIHNNNIKKGVTYVIKDVSTTNFVSEYGALSNAAGVRFTALKDGSSDAGNGTVYLPKGVNYRDLRAGIRLPILIDAIEECYGLTFTGDFFSESNEEFNRLYLWLQKDKGRFTLDNYAEFLFSEADYLSGSGDQRPLAPYGPTGEVRTYYRVTFNVVPASESDTYSIEVINLAANVSLFKLDGVGTKAFTKSIIQLTETDENVDLKVVISNFSGSSVSINYTVIYYEYDDDIRDFRPEGTSYYSSASISSELSYKVVGNMPKMKVIDFLTGLFNMFNLTAYADLDGNIVVDSLDEYYESGNTVNLTKYIDSSDRTVSRNNMYSQITYKFEDASTFAVLNSNEITGDEFGNEKIDNVYLDESLTKILAFDGGTYEINPKFEKIMYERMTDQSNGDVITDFGWGWAVDKDQKPNLIKPLLFYSELNVITSATPNLINFDSDAADIYYPVDRYYRPSNSISKPPLMRQSLHFGSEFDEFYYELDTPNEVSLFTRYWKNYILSIYDKKSRIINLEANLPVSIINSIKLKDTVVIRDNKYRINKIDVNITNGKAKLELVTWKEIIPFYDSDYRADTDVVTADSDLITADII